MLGPAAGQRGVELGPDEARHARTARFGARGSSPSILPDRFSSGRGVPFESPIFWR
jgi:hypothetical protein